MSRRRSNFGPRLDPPVRICDAPDCGEHGSCTEPLVGSFCARHVPESFWPGGKPPAAVPRRPGSSLWPESKDERAALLKQWRAGVSRQQGSTGA